MRAYKIIVALICALTPLLAQAQSPVSHWYLPQEVNDSNTKVRFEIDSTWHMVQGTTSHLSGKAELTDPGDLSSVSVSLALPVKAFDTDNSSRDERLREVMAEDAYPQVSVVAHGLTKGCTPALVMRDGSCQDALAAKLTIRDITKDFSLPVQITKSPDGFNVEGSLPFQWPDFHVEDPSIFIAKLKPTVTVFFSVHLGDSASAHG